MKLTGDWLGDVYAQDTGAGNGVTVTFALSASPHSAASVVVSLNGLRQKQGGGNDYTIDVGAGTITFTSAPVVGQELIVTYTKKV